jgi:hypothetical protein
MGISYGDVVLLYRGDGTARTCFTTGFLFAKYRSSCCTLGRLRDEALSRCRGYAPAGDAAILVLTCLTKGDYIPNRTMATVRSAGVILEAY